MADPAHLAILLVEDNPDLAANIADFLGGRGYVVDVAMDGATGLHLAVEQPHDVVVLDLTLPGIDGLTLCRRLRREARSTIPVLMLTARGTLEDKVAGYEGGADDYLTKPFELRELDLRLRALARRAQPGGAQRRLVVGDLSYDLDARTVRRAARSIELPAIPLKILEVLMTRSPAVVARGELELRVWGDVPPDSDALRVHLHTLRSAIDLPGCVPLIHTVRGVGYRIGSPDAPAA